MSGGSGTGFRSVVFDCDSTLVTIEGIDELAGERAAEVRALTERAMAGELLLEEVFGHRLEVISPTRDQVEALGERYARSLTPDARGTVEALRWLEKEVRIVSGGVLPAVLRLARELGVDEGAVAAVDLRFDESRRYRTFDRSSPLARSDGKEEVIRSWNLPRPTLLVGDGATDLAARAAVDAFAAYAGVVSRPPVSRAADHVLPDPSLTPVLSLAAGRADRERLAGSRFAPLLERGDRILAWAG